MRSCILCLAFAVLAWPNIVEGKSSTMRDLKFQVDCTSLAVLAITYDNLLLKNRFSRNPFLIIDRELTFKKCNNRSCETAVAMVLQDLDEKLENVTNSDFERFMNPIQEESKDRLVAEWERSGSFDSHHKKLVNCVSVLGK